MSDLPKIGEVYNCFDDGKINKSRLYQVQIKEIIPYNEAPQELKNKHKSLIKQYFWLYSENTDYFIEFESNERFSFKKEKQYFIRTKNGHWFGDGGFYNGSGLLDVKNEFDF